MVWCARSSPIGPKKLEIAVPANLKCGKPEGDVSPADESSWAPLTFTFAGIWEVQPQWLEDHLQDIQIVDVREASEFEGPLGRIPGAELIPLGQLTDRAGELSTDTPIVAVCRAGGRSTQATVILKREGRSFWLSYLGTPLVLCLPSSPKSGKWTTLLVGRP